MGPGGGPRERFRSFWAAVRHVSREWVTYLYDRWGAICRFSGIWDEAACLRRVTAVQLCVRFRL